MDSLKRTMKYQLNETIKGLAIFLGILLLVDIIGFVSNIRYNNMWSFGIHADAEMSVIGGNIMAIIIFFIAYSYSIYYEDFPIAICLSVTRKDYYKSMVLHNVIVAFVISLFQGVLFKIEPYPIRAAGINPLQDFIVLNTETDSLIYIVLIMFVAFLVYMSFWNLVAALNYKFGYRFWIVVVALFIFMIRFNFLGFLLDFLDTMFSSRWIEHNLNLFLGIFFGIGAVICYVLSYFVTLKTNVKHRAG